MAKRAQIKQPVVIEVGNYARFKITYLNFCDEEGPSVEFCGKVDDVLWRTLLRFDFFKNDPSYQYLPGTPEYIKYRVDRVVNGNPQSYLLTEVMALLPQMVRAIGYARLARVLWRDWDNLANQMIATEKSVRALERQEKRKAKKAKRS